MIRSTNQRIGARAVAAVAAMVLIAGMGSAATAVTLDLTEDLTTQSVEPESVADVLTDESISEPQAITVAPTDDATAEPATDAPDDATTMPADDAAEDSSAPPTEDPAEHTPAPSEEQSAPATEKAPDTSGTPSTPAGKTESATESTVDSLEDVEIGQSKVASVFAPDVTTFATIPVSGGVTAQMAGHRGYTGENGTATNSGNTIRYGLASNTTTSGSITNSDGASGGSSPWTGHSGWATAGNTAYSSHGCTYNIFNQPLCHNSRLDLSYQSALGFAPASVTSVETSQIFNLGRMVHRNNPVSSNSIANSWFRGTLNIQFQGRTIPYTWRLNETPNNNNLPQNHPDNDDYVDFLNQVTDQTFTSGGIQYTLVVHGFHEPKADGTCEATVDELSAVKNEFRTTEGTSTYGCLYASVSQVRDLTIKKQIEMPNGSTASSQQFSFSASSTLAGSAWASSGNSSFQLGHNGTKTAKYNSGEELTITETQPPASWSLKSVACVDGTGVAVPGVTYDLATGKLVIPAETSTESSAASAMTCTFTNEFVPFQCTPDTLINQASDDVGATGTASFNYLEAWSISDGGAWKEPFVDLRAAPYNITEQLNGLGVDETGYNFYFTTFGVGNANAKVYWYNSQTGALNSWAGAGMPANGNNQVRRGAVDLSTGIYYYQTTNNAANADGTRTHHIYGFDPTQNGGSGAGWYAGSVQTPAGGTSGDMAFDFNGNMYMSADNVTINGSAGNAVYVFNQPLPTFGNTISSSYPTGQLVTHIPNSGVANERGNVVGLAYSAQGSLYLSTLNGYMAKIDPVTGTWTESTVEGAPPKVDGSHTDDMATCVAPSTIKLEKDLPNGRHADTDQFDLEIYRVAGNRQVGVTATTSGTEGGVQTAHVGPAPIVTGQQYTIVEKTSGTTDFSQYVSTYECTDKSANAWVDVRGTMIAGTGGRLEATINVLDPPTASSGRAIECVIKNELKPKLTLVKEVDAGTAQPTNWTLSATGEGTPAPGISGVTGTSAVTDQSIPAGTYSLAESGNASVNGNHAWTDLVCKNGEDEIDGVATTDANGLVTGGSVELDYGDDVTCTFTNSAKPKLTLIKNADNPDVQGAAGYADDDDDWTLTAQGTPSANKVEGTTGINRVVPSGDYTLTEAWGGLEPDKSGGYDWTALVCTNANGEEATADIADVELDDDGFVDTASVGLGYGDDVTCTFTNTPKAGSVTWEKVDENNQPLANSEWTLIGPGVPADTEVTDCVEGPCSADAFKDQDPRAGYFEVKDLVWGDYTLTEAKAPAGYVLDDTEHAFTVGVPVTDSVKLEWDLGQIVNTPRDMPNLPLTGGLGRDFFFIAGGGVLLLGFGAVVAAQIRNRRREVA